MIPEPIEPEPESRSEPALPALPTLPVLPMEWEPPQTHQETQLQAEAIQNMLCSSISSSDTSTCCQNRANITAFTQDILATNILHDQLVGYMWESSLAKD